jgi:N-acetylmuramoyl-L-alanine amidase
MSLSFCNSFAAQVTNIASSQSGNKVALYFSVQGSFTHRVFTLSNPDRLVIDMEGSNLNVNLNQLKLANALIKQVRSGRGKTGTLRMVFELNQPVTAVSRPWYNGSLKGILVDLTSRGSLPVVHQANKATAASAPKKIAVNAKQSKAILLKMTQKKAPGAHPQLAHAEVNAPRIIHNTPIKVSHGPVRSLRDVIVVLDAGHGGKDPGAKGTRFSQEKHVVLAITLKLKQLIDKQPGMRAVLTRSGDYYVGLRQRLDIARKYNGDIFVSIHADAFNNPHSSGASVFALSQGGATSEAARWIAEKENYSELGGVNLGDLDDTNGIVRSVLIDLSQTATINSSVQMGSGVLSQLNHFTRLHNHRVDQARFMVLKSPDIPSILVETGFISNPVEEKNLTSPAYQSRLSQAIFSGIKDYFWSNPPHGTRLEAMASTKMHLVSRGETLPAIAARYRVSVNVLQATNHLSNHPSLRPGQKLIIPSSWA